MPHIGDRRRRRGEEEERGGGKCACYSPLACRSSRGITVVLILIIIVNRH